jgi:hypothetical protein
VKVRRATEPTASSHEASLSRSQLSFETVPVEVDVKVTLWPVMGSDGL